MKTLAVGVLLDAGLILLLSTHTGHGPDVDVLLLPLIGAGWTTVIGFAATVLSLLITTRRSVVVGLLFTVALGAGYGAGAFATTYERTDLDRALGIGLATAAGCAFTLGLLGIAWLALTGTKSVPEVDASRD